MTRYRKKPVVIEAVRYVGGPDGEVEGSTVPGWYIDALARGDAAFDEDRDCFVIRTMEGEHIASPGDWIIRGVKGELYPCKPDIFALTYEPEP